PKDRLLLLREDVISPPASRLLQRSDLGLGQSPPLPRSGMAAGSIFASVRDRSAEVGQLLQTRIQRAVFPNGSVELGEGSQQGWLVGQHFVEVRHCAQALLKRAIDPLNVRSGLVGLDRLYPHGVVTPTWWPPSGRSAGRGHEELGVLTRRQRFAIRSSKSHMIGPLLWYAEPAQPWPTTGHLTRSPRRFRRVPPVPVGLAG